MWQDRPKLHFASIYARDIERSYARLTTFGGNIYVRRTCTSLLNLFALICSSGLYMAFEDSSDANRRSIWFAEYSNRPRIHQDQTLGRLITSSRIINVEETRRIHGLELFRDYFGDCKCLMCNRHIYKTIDV